MIAKEMAEEQVRVLKQHGFGNLVWQNEAGVETFKEQLTAELSEILNSDDVYVVPVQIMGTLFGVIDNEKHEIAFHFGYEYDPIAQQLDMKIVIANLKGNELRLPIEHVSDLWPAKEYYDRLLAMTELKQEAASHNYLKAQQHTLGKQLSLLEEKGFTEESLKNGISNGRLSRMLEKRFTAAAQKMGSTPGIAHFTVETKACFENDPAAMLIKIHYMFDSRNIKLTPKSLTTTYKGKTEDRPCSPRYGIPSIEDLYRMVQGDEKTLKAYAILNRPITQRGFRIS